MSVRRALVGCVVLSVQDAAVCYPYCKGCFSRVDVDQRDTTRCRCSRCGYSCLREQVDYRYRLSLMAIRDKCIFGLTVFGTCLNPFFGIPASGLQRLVENADGQVGASTRASLLAKAVKDFFIGRHFIFGIKVPGTESRLCFGQPGLTKDGDRVQFIASQMLLPKASGLGGCTVVSYYQSLLQKETENELGPETCRPLETNLQLIHHPSPSSSFNNSTSAPRLLSFSLQRSQHQDSTLSPTPPWQQSLGLVTSSAEQEEGGSTQDYRANESGSQKRERVCLDKPKVTEERAPSPLFSSEHRSDDTQSLAICQNRSFEKAVETSPLLNSWLTTPQPGHTRDLTLSCKRKPFSTGQLPTTFSSSSVVWEDLPFSESLTEFLCEDFDIVSEAEPHLNVQNQSKAVRNNLLIRPQDRNLSVESTSVCQRSTRESKRRSWMLQDVTNLTDIVGDRHDFSDLACKDYTEEGQVSFENQEQLEGEAYDCSVDLFGCSLMMDANMESPTHTHSESVSRTTEPGPLPLKRHLRCEINVTHSTPDKHKVRSIKCRDSFIHTRGTQDLDFIPPTQSTPIVKVNIVPASPPSSSSSSTAGELSSGPNSQDMCVFYSELSESVKKTETITSSLSKHTPVRANQMCVREFSEEQLSWRNAAIGHKQQFTPKRRFWKPSKPKKLLPAQQRFRVGLETPERINRKRDSSVCDVTEDGEVFVPPTPAAKARLSVKLRGRRRKRQTGNSSNDLVSTWKEQPGDGTDYERNPSEHRLSSLTSSQKELAQTETSGGGEMGDVQSLDASDGFLPDEETQACDWSRDLFSDSV